MLNKRIFLVSAILLLSVIVSGCSWNPIKPVIVQNRTREIPVFHPPLPDGLSLNDIIWKVWTPILMKEYIKDLEAGKAPVIVFYGITPKGYEALSGNIAEFKRFIKGQKAIIRYYRKNLKKILPKKENTNKEEKGTEGTEKGTESNK